VRVIANPAFCNRSENSYNCSLYQALVNLGVEVLESSPQTLLRQRSDIWHIHWPEGFLNSSNRLKVLTKLGVLLGLITWAKQRGTKLVWTVHNLQSHEQYYPRLERWFWQYFTPRLDGYISLSQAGLATAQERFPALKYKPGFVIPHGHYRDEYPPPTDRHTAQSSARTQLGLPQDATVILFFGRIRAYKNVAQLIQLFSQIQQPNLRLNIAGRPEPIALKVELEQLIASDDRIQAHLDFVPQAQTATHFAAADLVVLPYREILNSGTALLALSLNCPVFVPQRGSMGELQQLVGDTWVKTYSGDLTVAALTAAIDWAKTTHRSPIAPLDAFDATTIAQQTLNAYNQILQK
jgi:beta-1,4-mannosyltransferase